MKLNFENINTPAFMEQTIALAISLMNPRMEGQHTAYERFVQLSFCREYILQDPLYAFFIETIDDYLHTPTMQQINTNLSTEREIWNKTKKLF